MLYLPILGSSVGVGLVSGHAKRIRGWEMVDRAMFKRRGVCGGEIRGTWKIHGGHGEVWGVHVEGCEEYEEFVEKKLPLMGETARR